MGDRMPFATLFRWPKSWCDRPNRTNQPTIHPQQHLSPGENLASWPCWPCLAWPHPQMGIWEASHVRRSSASLTKLMQAHSLFLHSVCVHPNVVHIRTRQRGAKKANGPTKETQSLFWHLRRSAHAGPGPGQPERSPLFPPRTRRDDHPHNNTTKHPPSLSALQ